MSFPSSTLAGLAAALLWAGLLAEPGGAQRSLVVAQASDARLAEAEQLN